MAVSKSVNMQLVATDEVSPKVIEISENMEKRLIKVNELTAKSFSKIQKASEKMSQQFGATKSKVNELSGANRQLSGDLQEIERQTGVLDVLEAGFANVSKIALASAAAIGGVAVIDAAFVPLNKVLLTTEQALLRTSFSADEAFTRFAQGGGTMVKLQEMFLRFREKGLEVARLGLTNFRTHLQDTRTVLQAFGNTMSASTKVAGGVSKTFIAAAKHTELFERGFTGLVTRASIGATAFGTLGSALIRSDSIMKKMAGVTLVALAVAMGGIVVLAHQMLNAVGNVAIAIGDKLTKSSIKQIDTFSEAEKTTFAFTQTIQAYSSSVAEAQKQTENWTKFQERMTEQTGTTAATVRALIAETISATEAFGLNEAQMQELVERSIDLSERAHKPAIDTLTALINGMNGAGQSVVALGLHINDAAVAHSKLSQEQKDLFETADDATKAQIRFAVLMEQAGKAAGFASNNADLYSKAVKIQKNAQETLNAELGRGAAIINGEYVFGLARATQLMTDFAKPILPAVGFVQALGGRLLTLAGVLTKNFLTITLVTSAIRALNVLFKKGFAEGLFLKEIPFINKSLTALAVQAGATRVQFDSLGGTAKTGLQILKTQSGNAVKSLLGLETSAKLSAGVIGGQLVKGMQAAAGGINKMTMAALRFVATPVGAVIAAVTAGAFLMFKAFEKLEQETGIFSDLWTDLVDSFRETAPAFQPIVDLFREVGMVISRIIVVQVKAAAAGLAFMMKQVFSVIQAFQELSQFLPESMRASTESIARMQDRINKMDAAMRKLGSGALQDLTNIFIGNAHAVEQSHFAMAEFEKNLAKLDAKIGKFSEKAKKAFEFAEDFTPQIRLDKFEKEAATYEAKVIELQGFLEEKKLTLMNAPEQTAEIQKMTQETIKKIRDTEEVIQGIRLKRAQETRMAHLEQVDIELQQKIQKVFTTEQAIQQRQLEAAQEIRDLKVQALTNQLLKERDMLSAHAQAGITIQQEAELEARNVQLEAFRARLEAEKQLAVSFEQQKQMELAQIRANLVQGTTQEAGATENVEVLKEQQKMAQLQALRENQKISEEQFQADMQAIQAAGAERRLQNAITLTQKRAQLLGMTDMGIKQQQLLADQEFELQKQQLAQQNFMTEAQRKQAEQQLEMEHQSRLTEIRKQGLQQQATILESRGQNFEALMKRIEASQEQHGQVMGTLRAVQASAEYGAVQGMLGNLASLQQSERRKEFEIGKKAAIAQTMVNTFMSATQAFNALAGIPIVGPALGAAAAAAAVAAGMMNIRRIKAQKFQGGGSGAANGAAPEAPNPTATVPAGAAVTGGQADQGMDAIPRSLAGKSFILSAGERVVQPEANRDLTGFLSKVNDSPEGLGGNTVNITVQGNISSRRDAELIADRVIEELRRRSERGQPVISRKGIA